MNKTFCIVRLRSASAWVAAFVSLAGLCLASLAAAGPNLVVNGSFSNPTDPLAAWKYKYDAPGESWYAGNDKLVSVLPLENGRKNVLRLNVATQFLADNPGVKTDSQPIPVRPGGIYRFSAWARSTGPDCRIMIEGYKWRPDTTPHPNPTLLELRKCYRASQLYYGRVKAGDFGGVDGQWRQASATWPEGRLGPLAQEMFNQIQFLVVHLIGIGGKAGDLFISDVLIERMN